MRLTNNYVLNFRRLAIAVCFLFWTLGGAQAQTPDINKIWTTVGSDGTIDEIDVGKVFFEGAVVQMGRVPVNTPLGKKSTLVAQTPVSAVIRYNVAPVDGLFFPTTPGCQPGTGVSCQGIRLLLRYLATGGNSRVSARLIEVDLANGAETVRLTFKSSDFAAADSYQLQSSADCGPRWRFDFTRKAYYVEATLTGSRITGFGAAGIQMIKVTSIGCPG
jgi:hypothetical protein